VIIGKAQRSEGVMGSDVENSGGAASSAALSGVANYGVANSGEAASSVANSSGAAGATLSGAAMRKGAVRGGAVLLGALLMTWPAVYNGYPLLYADSMSYLQAGREVTGALFQGKPAYQTYYRSLIYALGIFPLHWNVSAWGVVALNALLTSYVLWLVVRSILPRHTVRNYFALVAPLCACTSVSWLVSWVMPDILGPLLYLSIYLLVCAHEDLSRAEIIAVCLIAWWGLASHISHFPVAAGLWVFLAAVLAVQRRLTRARLQALGGVAMIVVAAAASLAAINAAYYGRPSLEGPAPPFLMARIIADGPGEWYLHENCGRVQFSICARVNELPDTAIDFLWPEQGIWNTSPPGEQQRLKGEELRFVAATLREYPRQELRIASGNFFTQLHSFGAYIENDPFILQWMDRALPGARGRYLNTKEAKRTLHEEFFRVLQEWTVVVALVVIAGMMIAVPRERWSQRLVALSATIVFVVIANAAVTSILSAVDSRYEERVIWLVPLLAGAFVLTVLDARDSVGRIRTSEVGEVTGE
jgi:hypothetical protein